MQSLHDRDGSWKVSEIIGGTDWEGRQCTRCPKKHWLPDPLVKHDIASEEFTCLACRFDVGDLVLLTEPHEIKGYVGIVVTAGANVTLVRLLDAPVGEGHLPYKGREALSLVKTGKSNEDLAYFGPDLVAEAIEKEMGVVDFILKKRGVRKGKGKVKSAEDLVFEALGKALVKKATEAGKLGELMKEVTK